MKRAPLFTLSMRFLIGKKSREGADTSRRSLRGSILGIALSLVPFVVVLQLADGMIEGIVRRSVELWTYHVQVFPQNGSTAEDLTDAASLVALLPGVSGAWAERNGLGMVIRGEKRGGATIRALSPSLLKENADFASLLRVTEGALSLDERRSVILGSALALDLGARTGDRVQLLSLRSGEDGSLVPQISQFRVAGIVSSGYQDLDGLWALIRLDEGFKLLPAAASRSFVGVKADSFSLPGLLGAAPPLPESLQTGLPDGWYAEGWYSLLQAQIRSLMVTRLLLILITGLIVLVASANVFSAVVMLVIERRQDIAILRSMGAGKADITMSFTMAGAFIGLAASALGIAAGLFAAVNVNEAIRGLEAALGVLSGLSARARGVEAAAIHVLDPRYYLQEIPIRIAAGQIMALAAFTVVVSSFAAWIPARAAGRIEPMEVMRKS